MKQGRRNLYLHNVLIVRTKSHEAPIPDHLGPFSNHYFEFSSSWSDLPTLVHNFQILLFAKFEKKKLFDRKKTHIPPAAVQLFCLQQVRDEVLAVVFECIVFEEPFIPHIVSGLVEHIFYCELLALQIQLESLSIFFSFVCCGNIDCAVLLAHYILAPHIAYEGEVEEFVKCIFLF